MKKSYAKVIESVHKQWCKQLKSKAVIDVITASDHCQDEAFMFLGGGLDAMSRALLLQDVEIRRKLLRELAQFILPNYNLELMVAKYYIPSPIFVRRILAVLHSSSANGSTCCGAGILTQNFESEDSGIVELSLLNFRAVVGALFSMPVSFPLRQDFLRGLSDDEDSPLIEITQYINSAASLFKLELADCANFDPSVDMAPCEIFDSIDKICTVQLGLNSLTHARRQSLKFGPNRGNRSRRNGAVSSYTLHSQTSAAMNSPMSSPGVLSSNTLAAGANGTQTDQVQEEILKRFTAIGLLEAFRVLSLVFYEAFAPSNAPSVISTNPELGDFMKEEINLKAQNGKISPKDVVLASSGIPMSAFSEKVEEKVNESANSFPQEERPFGPSVDANGVRKPRSNYFAGSVMDLHGNIGTSATLRARLLPLLPTLIPALAFFIALQQKDLCKILSVPLPLTSEATAVLTALRYEAVNAFSFLSNILVLSEAATPDQILENPGHFLLLKTIKSSISKSSAFIFGAYTTLMEKIHIHLVDVLDCIARARIAVANAALSQERIDESLNSSANVKIRRYKSSSKSSLTSPRHIVSTAPTEALTAFFPLSLELTSRATGDEESVRMTSLGSAIISLNTTIAPAEYESAARKALRAFFMSAHALNFGSSPTSSHQHSGFYSQGASNHSFNNQLNPGLNVTVDDPHGQNMGIADVDPLLELKTAISGAYLAISNGQPQLVPVGLWGTSTGSPTPQILSVMPDGAVMTGTSKSSTFTVPGVLGMTFEVAPASILNQGLSPIDLSTADCINIMAVGQRALMTLFYLCFHENAVNFAGVWAAQMDQVRLGVVTDAQEHLKRLSSAFENADDLYEHESVGGSTDGRGAPGQAHGAMGLGHNVSNFNIIATPGGSQRSLKGKASPAPGRSHAQESLPYDPTLDSDVFIPPYTSSVAPFRTVSSLVFALCKILALPLTESLSTFNSSAALYLRLLSTNPSLRDRISSSGIVPALLKTLASFAMDISAKPPPPGYKQLPNMPLFVDQSLLPLRASWRHEKDSLEALFLHLTMVEGVSSVNGSLDLLIGEIEMESSDSENMSDFDTIDGKSSAISGTRGSLASKGSRSSVGSRRRDMHSTAGIDLHPSRSDGAPSASGTGPSMVAPDVVRLFSTPVDPANASTPLALLPPDAVFSENTEAPLSSHRATKALTALIDGLENHFGKSLGEQGAEGDNTSRSFFTNSITAKESALIRRGVFSGKARMKPGVLNPMPMSTEAASAFFHLIRVALEEAYLFALSECVRRGIDPNALSTVLESNSALGGDSKGPSADAGKEKDRHKAKFVSISAPRQLSEALQGPTPVQRALLLMDFFIAQMPALGLQYGQQYTNVLQHTSGGVTTVHTVSLSNTVSNLQLFSHAHAVALQKKEREAGSSIGPTPAVTAAAGPTPPSAGGKKVKGDSAAAPSSSSLNQKAPDVPPYCPVELSLWFYSFLNIPFLTYILSQPLPFTSAHAAEFAELLSTFVLQMDVNLWNHVSGPDSASARDSASSGDPTIEKKCAPLPMRVTLPYSETPSIAVMSTPFGIIPRLEHIMFDFLSLITPVLSVPDVIYAANGMIMPDTPLEGIKQRYHGSKSRLLNESLLDDPNMIQLEPLLPMLTQVLSPQAASGLSQYLDGLKARNASAAAASAPAPTVATGKEKGKSSKDAEAEAAAAAAAAAAAEQAAAMKSPAALPAAILKRLAPLTSKVGFRSLHMLSGLDGTIRYCSPLEMPIPESVFTHLLPRAPVAETVDFTFPPWARPCHNFVFSMIGTSPIHHPTFFLNPYLAERPSKALQASALEHEPRGPRRPGQDAQGQQGSSTSMSYSGSQMSLGMGVDRRRGNAALPSGMFVFQGEESFAQPLLLRKGRVHSRYIPFVEAERLYTLGAGGSFLPIVEDDGEEEQEDTTAAATTAVSDAMASISATAAVPPSSVKGSKPGASAAASAASTARKGVPPTSGVAPPVATTTRPPTSGEAHPTHPFKTKRAFYEAVAVLPLPLPFLVQAAMDTVPIMRFVVPDPAFQAQAPKTSGSLGMASPPLSTVNPVGDIDDAFAVGPQGSTFNLNLGLGSNVPNAAPGSGEGRRDFQRYSSARGLAAQLHASSPSHAHSHLHTSLSVNTAGSSSSAGPLAPSIVFRLLGSVSPGPPVPAAAVRSDIRLRATRSLALIVSTLMNTAEPAPPTEAELESKKPRKTGRASHAHNGVVPPLQIVLDSKLHVFFANSLVDNIAAVFGASRIASALSPQALQRFASNLGCSVDNGSFSGSKNEQHSRSSEEFEKEDSGMVFPTSGHSPRGNPALGSMTPIDHSFSGDSILHQRTQTIALALQALIHLLPDVDDAVRAVEDTLKHSERNSKNPAAAQQMRRYKKNVLRFLRSFSYVRETVGDDLALIGPLLPDSLLVAGVPLQALTAFPSIRSLLQYTHLLPELSEASAAARASRGDTEGVSPTAASTTRSNVDAEFVLPVAVSSCAVSLFGHDLPNSRLSVLVRPVDAAAVNNNSNFGGAASTPAPAYPSPTKGLPSLSTAGATGSLSKSKFVSKLHEIPGRKEAKKLPPATTVEDTTGVVEIRQAALFLLAKFASLENSVTAIVQHARVSSDSRSTLEAARGQLELQEEQLDALHEKRRALQERIVAAEVAERQELVKAQQHALHARLVTQRNEVLDAAHAAAVAAVDSLGQANAAAMNLVNSTANAGSGKGKGAATKSLTSPQKPSKDKKEEKDKKDAKSKGAVPNVGTVPDVLAPELQLSERQALGFDIPYAEVFYSNGQLSEQAATVAAAAAPAPTGKAAAAAAAAAAPADSKVNIDSLTLELAKLNCEITALERLIDVTRLNASVYPLPQSAPARARLHRCVARLLPGIFNILAEEAASCGEVSLPGAAVPFVLGDTDDLLEGKLPFIQQHPNCVPLRSSRMSASVDALGNFVHIAPDAQVLPPIMRFLVSGPAIRIGLLRIIDNIFSSDVCGPLLISEVLSMLQELSTFSALAEHLRFLKDAYFKEFGVLPPSLKTSLALANSADSTDESISDARKSKEMVIHSLERILLASGPDFEAPTLITTGVPTFQKALPSAETGTKKSGNSMDEKSSKGKEKEKGKGKFLERVRDKTSVVTLSGRLGTLVLGNSADYGARMFTPQHFLTNVHDLENIFNSAKTTVDVTVASSKFTSIPFPAPPSFVHQGLLEVEEKAMADTTNPPATEVAAEKSRRSSTDTVAPAVTQNSLAPMRGRFTADFSDMENHVLTNVAPARVNWIHPAEFYMHLPPIDPLGISAAVGTFGAPPGVFTGGHGTATDPAATLRLPPPRLPHVLLNLTAASLMGETALPSLTVAVSSNTNLGHISFMNFKSSALSPVCVNFEPQNNAFLSFFAANPSIPPNAGAVPGASMSGSSQGASAVGVGSPAGKKGEGKEKEAKAGRRGSVVGGVTGVSASLPSFQLVPQPPVRIALLDIFAPASFLWDVSEAGIEAVSTKLIGAHDGMPSLFANSRANKSNDFSFSSATPFQLLPPTMTTPQTPGGLPDVIVPRPVRDLVDSINHLLPPSFTSIAKEMALESLGQSRGAAEAAYRAAKAHPRTSTMTQAIPPVPGASTTVALAPLPPVSSLLLVDAVRSHILGAITSSVLFPWLRLLAQKEPLPSDIEAAFALNTLSRLMRKPSLTVSNQEVSSELFVFMSLRGGLLHSLMALLCPPPPPAHTHPLPQRPLVEALVGASIYRSVHSSQSRMASSAQAGTSAARSRGEAGQSKNSLLADSNPQASEELQVWGEQLVLPHSIRHLMAIRASLLLKWVLERPANRRLIFSPRMTVSSRPLMRTERKWLRALMAVNFKVHLAVPDSDESTWTQQWQREMSKDYSRLEALNDALDPTEEAESLMHSIKEGGFVATLDGGLQLDKLNSFRSFRSQISISSHATDTSARDTFVAGGHRDRLRLPQGPGIASAGTVDIEAFIGQVVRMHEPAHSEQYYEFLTRRPAWMRGVLTDDSAVLADIIPELDANVEMVNNFPESAGLDLPERELQSSQYLTYANTFAAHTVEEKSGDNVPNLETYFFSSFDPSTQRPETFHLPQPVELPTEGPLPSPEELQQHLQQAESLRVRDISEVVQLIPEIPLPEQLRVPAHELPVHARVLEEAYVGIADPTSPILLQHLWSRMLIYHSLPLPPAPVRETGVTVEPETSSKATKEKDADKGFSSQIELQKALLEYPSHIANLMGYSVVPALGSVTGAGTAGGARPTSSAKPAAPAKGKEKDKEGKGAAGASSNAAHQLTPTEMLSVVLHAPSVVAAASNPVLANFVPLVTALALSINCQTLSPPEVPGVTVRLPAHLPQRIISPLKASLTAAVNAAKPVGRLANLPLTPLVASITCLLPPVFSLALLAAGADPNSARREDGITPLMLTLLMGDRPLARALLRAGADLNAKCKAGNPVLKYAVLSPSPAERNLLVRAAEAKRDAIAVYLPVASLYTALLRRLRIVCRREDELRFDVLLQARQNVPSAPVQEGQLGSSCSVDAHVTPAPAATDASHTSGPESQGKAGLAFNPYLAAAGKKLAATGMKKIGRRRKSDDGTSVVGDGGSSDSVAPSPGVTSSVPRNSESEDQHEFEGNHDYSLSVVLPVSLSGSNNTTVGKGVVGAGNSAISGSTSSTNNNNGKFASSAPLSDAERNKEVDQMVSSIRNNLDLMSKLIRVQRASRQWLTRTRILKARHRVLFGSAEENFTEGVPVLQANLPAALRAVDLLIAASEARRRIRSSCSESVLAELPSALAPLSMSPMRDSAGNTLLHWISAGSLISFPLLLVCACRFVPVFVPPTTDVAVGALLKRVRRISGDRFTEVLNSGNNRGFTALHSAAESGNFTLAFALLNSGADVTLTDSFGNTAIHYAAIGRTVWGRDALQQDYFSKYVQQYLLHQSAQMSSASPASQVVVNFNPPPNRVTPSASSSPGPWPASIDPDGFKIGTMNKMRFETSEKALQQRVGRRGALASAPPVPLARVSPAAVLLDALCARAAEQVLRKSGEIYSEEVILDLLDAPNAFGVTPVMVAAGAPLVGTMPPRTPVLSPNCLKKLEALQGNNTPLAARSRALLMRGHIPLLPPTAAVTMHIVPATLLRFSDAVVAAAVETQSAKVHSYHFDRSNIFPSESTETNAVSPTAKSQETTKENHADKEKEKCNVKSSAGARNNLDNSGEKKRRMSSGGTAASSSDASPTTSGQSASSSALINSSLDTAYVSVVMSNRPHSRAQFLTVCAREARMRTDLLYHMLTTMTSVGGAALPAGALDLLVRKLLPSGILGDMTPVLQRSAELVELDPASVEAKPNSDVNNAPKSGLLSRMRSMDRARHSGSVSSLKSLTLFEGALESNDHVPEGLQNKTDGEALDEVVLRHKLSESLQNCEVRAQQLLRMHLASRVISRSVYAQTFLTSHAQVHNRARRLLQRTSANGRTALHYAALSQNTALVDLLYYDLSLFSAAFTDDAQGFKSSSGAFFNNVDARDNLRGFSYRAALEASVPEYANSKNSQLQEQGNRVAQAALADFFNARARALELLLRAFSGLLPFPMLQLALSPMQYPPLAHSAIEVIGHVLPRSLDSNEFKELTVARNVEDSVVTMNVGASQSVREQLLQPAKHFVPFDVAKSMQTDAGNVLNNAQVSFTADRLLEPVGVLMVKAVDDRVGLVGVHSGLDEEVEEDMVDVSYVTPRRMLLSGPLFTSDQRANINRGLHRAKAAVKTTMGLLQRAQSKNLLVAQGSQENAPWGPDSGLNVQIPPPSPKNRTPSGSPNLSPTSISNSSISSLSNQIPSVRTHIRQKPEVPNAVSAVSLLRSYTQNGGSAVAHLFFEFFMASMWKDVLSQVFNGNSEEFLTTIATSYNLLVSSNGKFHDIVLGELERLDNNELTMLEIIQHFVNISNTNNRRVS